MTLQEYNEIMTEASRQYQQYTKMSQEANIANMIARKEDYPEYWIAVVAKERGKVAAKNPE